VSPSLGRRVAPEESTIRRALKAVDAGRLDAVVNACLVVQVTGRLRPGQAPEVNSSVIFRSTGQYRQRRQQRKRQQPQAPEHHLADPALAARLLAATHRSLLTAGGAPGDVAPVPRDGPLLGALFESLVALSVRVYAQAGGCVYHLRARNGDHEVDLIIEGPDRGVVALEVKLTPTAGDSAVAHLRWLRDDIGDRLAGAVVVTSGPYAYRRPDGIAVVPAGRETPGSGAIRATAWARRPSGPSSSCMSSPLSSTIS
jgi:hypothetical protein